MAAALLVVGVAAFCMIAFGICRTGQCAEPAPPVASPDEPPKRDYRRVIVAVYYMPGTDPKTERRWIFGRRREHKAPCPGCVLQQSHEQRLMEARPDAFWGLSGDGKTPNSIVSFSGKEVSYPKQTDSGIALWPTTIVYAGTPGSWGEERYRMTGYTAKDFDRLIQMIDWAAEY